LGGRNPRAWGRRGLAGRRFLSYRPVVLERPELTADSFEILVVRELRKAGLEVAELSIHRRTTLSESEPALLLELKGVLSRGPWRRRILIACRRQQRPIGRGEVESLEAHVSEAAAEAGVLFATPPFESDALRAAADGSLALLRVTDGRTAFDTGGWGTPSHYPAWLPAYCAQVVIRDPLGQAHYQLLEAGQADLILNQLEPARGAGSSPRVAPPEEAEEDR